MLVLVLMNLTFNCFKDIIELDKSLKLEVCFES